MLWIWAPDESPQSEKALSRPNESHSLGFKNQSNQPVSKIKSAHADSPDFMDDL